VAESSQGHVEDHVLMVVFLDACEIQIRRKPALLKPLALQLLLIIDHSYENKAIFDELF
jgi:hypothetical protein